MDASSLIHRRVFDAGLRYDEDVARRLRGLGVLARGLVARLSRPVRARHGAGFIATGPRAWCATRPGSAPLLLEACGGATPTCSQRGLCSPPSSSITPATEGGRGDHAVHGCRTTGRAAPRIGSRRPAVAQPCRDRTSLASSLSCVGKPAVVVALGRDKLCRPPCATSRPPPMRRTERPSCGSSQANAFASGPATVLAGPTSSSSLPPRSPRPSRRQACSPIHDSAQRSCGWCGCRRARPARRCAGAGPGPRRDAGRAGSVPQEVADWEPPQRWQLASADASDARGIVAGLRREIGGTPPLSNLARRPDRLCLGV